MPKIVLILCCLASLSMRAQLHQLSGVLYDRSGAALPFGSVGLLGTTHACQSDENGKFTFKELPAGSYTLVVVVTGYETLKTAVLVPGRKLLHLTLNGLEQALHEVVVTGTLKEMSKEDSPVNIDVISPALLQKTSTPNLFEATSLVNGVKPQINCNVCNTGDIHINGLEGPYTLILIDGMPIVSGLSSVYGLMGIPASMIERLEIMKGPAGALFGSEAMGGTINLITKRPALAPRFYLDYYGTSYLENNLDLGARLKLGRANWLLGTNTYFYDNITDINKDGFTDVTLQKRWSFFNKVSFDRKDGKDFSIAGRYVYEDRWGGQTNYTSAFRGGDSIYGESIYANRAELISNYQWPVKEDIRTQLSWNLHDQNSYYGVTPFFARQNTSFAQTYWSKTMGRHDLVAGLAYKHLWYDDNTVVTGSPGGGNLPDVSGTAGIFVQSETSLDTLSKQKLLLGLRLDHNQVYGFIPSPRIAYKWSPHYRLTMRVNAGTGFRIVNVFAEDHAALTGARQVVFVDRIDPERSYNASLNFVYKMRMSRRHMLLWDLTGFYYHFTNKIFANYDLDPEKVIYSNLNGFAYSRGASLNLSNASMGNLKIMLGVTVADVQNVQRDQAGSFRRSRQLQAPFYSGNVIAGYYFKPQKLQLDITGNWYGPQRLPVFPGDFRPEYSPWFMLLNAQFSRRFKTIELYAGVKNLFNFIPRDPIMRPHDPFDKQVNNEVDNPSGYTFDPSYNYAPVQGIRVYGGLRLTLQ